MFRASDTTYGISVWRQLSSNVKCFGQVHTRSSLDILDIYAHINIAEPESRVS